MKPQLSQLRNAHEASNAMVRNLSDQLKAALSGQDKEARQAGEARRLSSHYKREANRYKQEGTDLAAQVRNNHFMEQLCLQCMYRTSGMI